MSRGLALAGALALLLGACGSSGASSPSGSPGQAPGGNLTVLAAASLTDAFKAEAARFQRDHPPVQVKFSFAGSSTLASQVQQGAPADDFASADEANMKKVQDPGLLLGAPVIFATNRLQIVVAPGNPKHIIGLAGLAGAGVAVDLCQPAVPCGTYAAQALGKAGATVKPVSQETDVKGVVIKVELGEADAGIVYATDVMAAGSKVTGIDIPDDQNVVARYPVAVLKVSTNAAAARAFNDFILSSDGQAILRGYGFSAP